MKMAVPAVFGLIRDALSSIQLYAPKQKEHYDGCRLCFERNGPIFRGHSARIDHLVEETLLCFCKLTRPNLYNSNCPVALLEESLSLDLDTYP